MFWDLAPRRSWSREAEEYWLKAMLSVVIDVSPHGWLRQAGHRAQPHAQRTKFEQAICHATFFFIKANGLS
jgi:hypothetical protein